MWRFRRYGSFPAAWLPLAFYALSIAYGSVPIYVPVWYPLSYYNVRYGLELLPVFAVFTHLLAGFIARAMKQIGAQERGLVSAARRSSLASYLSAYRETPITLREAQVNSRGRIAMERALANYLDESALRDAADVWSRACRCAATGGHSAASRNL